MTENDSTSQSDAGLHAASEVVAIRDGGDDRWGVFTVRCADRTYQTQPCHTCPWAKDSPVGVFPPEVFRHSAQTAYDVATHVFGCHSSGVAAPRTCAGFLLRGAAHNLTVRLFGPDTTAIHTDRELYDSYRDMAIANGVALDDPVLAPCRDNRT